MLAALAIVAVAWWQWPRMVKWFGPRQAASRLTDALPAVADWARQLIQGSAGFPTVLLVASLAAFLALVGMATYVVLGKE